MSSVVKVYAIDLDLLGITYRLRTNSVGWSAFMRQLWEPFVVELDVPMFTFEITEGTNEYTLSLPDHEPVLLDDTWAVVNSIKYSLVDHALPRADTVLALHAAVVEKEGVRALLVGGSQAGKTTLCLELTERGWRYGSDDLAPLAADDGRVLIFPRAIAVRDPEVWDRYLDRWDPPEWLPRPTGPFQVPPSVFEVMEPGYIEPTHVFFIDPDHGSGPAAQQLSRAFATAQLSQYVRWFRGHDLGPLAQLGRSVEAWALSYRSPTEGADGVARACFGAESGPRGS